MKLPEPLQRGIEELLQGLKLSQLSKESKALSARYSSSDQRSDPASSRSDIYAYIVTRMPSIFGVLFEIFQEIAIRLPNHAPHSLIDFGSGPGTVLWAATSKWPDISSATLIDRNPYFQEIGKMLAAYSTDPIFSRASWLGSDLEYDRDIALSPSDMVTASYMLNELSLKAQQRLLDRMWQLSPQVVVLIEPGTPRGFDNILRARTQLLNHGAHLMAPCAGAGSCPLAGKSWCHFSKRIERSSLQRKVKAATLSYEDEKYSYLIATREPPPTIAARVMGTPVHHKHQIVLEFCTAKNTLEKRSVLKKDRDAFRHAKKLRWGSYM
jgi:ribosomal protein RSM22 (predicted rRNA methylase)